MKGKQKILRYRRRSLIVPLFFVLVIIASTLSSKTSSVTHDQTPSRTGDLKPRNRLRTARQIAPGAAMTLSLSPIADAYVASATTSSNFGLDPELRSKRSNLESYLKFDISAVGTESITSAKLRLTGGLSDTSTTNVVTQVFGVSSTSWTETAVVWSNKPSSSSTALSSVTIVNNVPAQYEWDVSTFFKTQQGSGRTVVSLAGDESDGRQHRQCDDAIQRRKLCCCLRPGRTKQARSGSHWSLDRQDFGGHLSSG